MTSVSQSVSQSASQSTSLPLCEGDLSPGAGGRQVLHDVRPRVVFVQYDVGPFVAANFVVVGGREDC